jgi:hypothetical protein
MLKADACDVVYCIHWLEDNRKIILQAKKQTKKKVYNLPHQGGDKRPTFTKLVLPSPPAQSSAPLYFVYYLHAFITFATCATVIVAATLDQVLSKVSSSFHFALVLVCQLSRI